MEDLTQMESDSVDLCLLDPPYFDYVTHHRKSGGDGKLSQSLVQQSQEDQLRTIQECIRILKPDRSFWVFTNWRNIWWMQERFQSLWRNMIIWDKGNWTAGDLKGSFGNQYEVILLGAKGKWKFKAKREPDIWSIPRMGTDRIHSTEKPVELYKKIIVNSTDIGDWVLDPYGGSGASLIAALETGRDMWMWEIDPEYYRRIEDRVKEIGGNNDKRS